MTRFRLMLLGTIMVAGCSAEPRIDASTREAYRKSLSGIEKALDQRQQTELERAIAELARSTVLAEGGEVPYWIDVGNLALGREWELVKSQVAGKTASDIIKLGASEELPRKQAELSEVEKELGAMRDGIAKREAVLSSIEVLEPAFIPPDGLRMRPTLSFSVQNTGSLALKQLHFEAVLTSPGRSVPWVADSLAYTFPGGLEPGEIRKLDLGANMFSEWGNDELASRDDLSLAITPAGYEDAAGNLSSLYDQEAVANLETKAAEVKERVETLSAILAP